MATVSDPQHLGAFSNLELRHLAALDAVAETGTFGRAALVLGYTQSAVSQQIAALEKAVGGAVFDRPGGPRPVSLTPLGKVVLAQGRDLLARARGAAKAIEQFKSDETGRVDIGTFQSVSNGLLPALVTELRREHPGVDIRLSEDELGVVPQLLAGELDLAFVVGPIRDDLDHVKLLDDPYVLVARHGEFPSGPVALDRLDGTTMVAYPQKCDGERVEAVLAASGVRPVIAFRTEDNGAVMAMVRAGMGPALMPVLAVSVAEDDPDLCLHRLRPAIAPRQIYVAWHRGRTLSTLASRVVEMAGDIARRHASEHTAILGRRRAQVA